MAHPLNRRDFAKLAGAGSLSALAPRIARASRNKPNIVLIMADDMGFSDIGCYGGEIPTPNLDRLAAGGLRFAQFYNAARCCPTRASLLTGLYPHQAGVGHMVGRRGDYPAYQGYLNNQCVTLAEVLAPAGYRTSITGKWHVGSRPGHWPLDRGFHRFYGSNTSTGHYFRINEDNYDRRLILDDQEIQPPAEWYATDAYTDYAIQFAEEALDGGEPFFLYMAYTAPHWPLHALPGDIARHRGRYKTGWDALRIERRRRMIEMGLVEEQWALPPRGGAAWDELTDEQRDEMDLRMAVYAAMIDRMDRGIGRLADTLERRGRLDGTLILFLSDNGGCAEGGPFGFTRTEGETGGPDSYTSYGLCWANASNTPFRRYKSWTHEGGIATPLIAHWPSGIEARGGWTNQVGHVIDIMPTLCEIAGAEYPERFKGNAILPTEGRSLLPVLQGREREGHEALFWEHEGNRAVRVGGWKLVGAHPDAWELYNLREDRTELNDLSSTHPERVAEMAQRYEAWAQRCGAQPWPVE